MKDVGGVLIFSVWVGEEVWDNGIVVVFYVVVMDDGSFWFYYVGFDDFKMGSGMGMVVSEGCNFRLWICL